MTCPRRFHTFGIIAPGQMFGGAVLIPWDQRKRTTLDLNGLLSQQMGSIAGLKTAVFPATGPARLERLSRTVRRSRARAISIS